MPEAAQNTRCLLAIHGFISRGSCSTLPCQLSAASYLCLAPRAPHSCWDGAS